MSLQIALRSGSAQKLCSLIHKMQNVEMSSSKLEQLGSLFCCIPQGKICKFVPASMVIHKFLHTWQNLITNDAKIDFRLDQNRGHLVILPCQKLEFPIYILRHPDWLKLLPIGQAIQRNLHSVDSVGLYLADAL